MKKFILAMSLLLAAFTAADAVPAYPGPVKVTQPDGTLLTLYLHGDEYLNWATCGNSLVAQDSTGWWRYSSFDAKGVSKVRGARVTRSSSGNGSSVTPPAPAVAEALARRNAAPREAATSSISTGTKRFLILLIEFSDKSFTMSKSDFADMLSGSNYTYNDATGSVNRYYQDVSFGKFNPVFDVYGPIKVSKTSAYYATGTQDCYAVIDACKYAHDSLGVNFANYCNARSSYVDNVFYFFPGYNQAEGGGSSCIWPHAVSTSGYFLKLDGKSIWRYGCASEFKGSSGSTMAGIGTFCHEFGHILGLPDFYDTDYYVNGYGSALQSLSLMSSGNYNNEGRTPPYLTWEEKNMLGWADTLTLLKEGANTLAKTSGNAAYCSPTMTEGEYYLYESRPAEGWDKYTGAPGLAIYHIDKSDYVMPDGNTAAQHWSSGDMINAYAKHQCMDLVESVSPESSVYYTTQLVFPGSDNVTSFTSATTPSAAAWSGIATGYNLTGITFDSATGSTTLTVQKDNKLFGTVKNLSGEAVSGAEILLTASSQTVEGSAQGLRMMRSVRKSGAGQYRILSDSEGGFEIQIPEGTYTVSVTAEGCLDYSDNVTVDAVTELNVTLTRPVDAAYTELRKYQTISRYSSGYGAGVSVFGGLRYSSDEIASYEGSRILSVSFMAANGGDGTAEKMGVKVYFDNELQCDCECKEHIFGTLCTVDISSFDLRIPSGKSVTFVYYVLEPSYAYTAQLADLGSTPVTGANLISYLDGNTIWGTISNANLVISAAITDHGKVVDLAGFNYIPKASSYKAGDSFELKLVESSLNKPSSVSWTVDGESVSASSVTLKAGVTTVRAFITYASGRTETVETRIQAN